MNRIHNFGHRILSGSVGSPKDTPMLSDRYYFVSNLLFHIKNGPRLSEVLGVRRHWGAIATKSDSAWAESSEPEGHCDKSIAYPKASDNTKELGFQGWSEQ